MEFKLGSRIIITAGKDRGATGTVISKEKGLSQADKHIIGGLARLAFFENEVWVAWDDRPKGSNYLRIDAGSIELLPSSMLAEEARNG